MSADLHARVDNAIARVKATRAADEVLAEIGTTHILMDRDEAMHLYHVLMAANKTMAARKLFDLLEEQQP